MTFLTTSYRSSITAVLRLDYRKHNTTMYFQSCSRTVLVYTTILRSLGNHLILEL